MMDSASNLSIDKALETISWDYKGRKVSVRCRHPRNALLSVGDGIVIALGGEDEFPTALLAFEFDGRERYRVGAPPGFRLAYLTSHPEAGAAVVCCADQKIDGWYDWHFAVDPSNGTLRRYCPAY